MKKFQANYTYASPNFYFLNLADTHVKTIFWEVLNQVKKNFEMTYPIPLSKYLKEEIGDIGKLPNYTVPADDFKKIVTEDISEELLVTKLLPTSIMRFQHLLIELLMNNYLKFEDKWVFNILLPNQKELEIFENTTYREEMYGLVQVVGRNALELAIIDLLHLVNDLLPATIKLPKPVFSIDRTIDYEKFVPSINAVNIDFSLFDTFEEDPNRNPAIISVRTDFGDN